MNLPAVNWPDCYWYEYLWSTAIVAAAPIIKAKETEVGYNSLYNNLWDCSCSRIQYWEISYF